MDPQVHREKPTPPISSPAGTHTAARATNLLTTAMASQARSVKATNELVECLDGNENPAAGAGACGTPSCR
jgi:hypothetical protein